MTGIVKNRTVQFGFFAALFILIAYIAVNSQDYYLAALPFALLVFYLGWQKPEYLLLLLLLSLPFSAEYMVTDTLGTDFPDELLMVITAFIALCYWLMMPRIQSHPLLVLLILGYVWSVLTAIFSTEPLVSVKFLLAKAWYIGAFVLAPLLLFREKQTMRKAIAALVISMVIVVAITVIRHAEYNFAFASINKALSPFFRNHVNYSAMLVCVIPVVFIYQRTTTIKGMKGFAAIVLLLLLVALFLSYSRGAWLALLIGMLSAILIKKRRIITGYCLAILLVIAALFWLRSDDRYLDYAHDYRTTIWHKDFKDHIVATYQLKDVSTAERFYRWIAGVRMIKDNWITGYGPNTFYQNYKPYAIPAFKTWVSNNREKSTVHNYYLLLTIEQGLPALIIFLLIAGYLLYYAQQIYHRTEDKFYKTAALLSGIVMMMILTVNFLSDLIETDKIGSLFFLCLSVIVIADVKTRNYEVKSQK